MTLPDAYIAVEDADELAARVVDSAAWTHASAERRAAALIQASDEIDSLRYAGRKYAADQARQFPRFCPDDPGEWPAGKRIESGQTWDLDEDGSAIVPPAVEMAVLLQAVSILADPQRAARLADRHDGIVGQSAGGVSESYSATAGVRTVCLAAMRWLRPYLLSGGRIV